MSATSPALIFGSLCSVSFLARFSYALARNPVLPLFALFLGAGPEAVGLAVGISTVTGIFFKLPAGSLSDVIGRRRTMLAGLLFFALMPFAYLAITEYQHLVMVRFLHGLATAIYGPVAMAVVADIAGSRKGEWLSWFSSVAIIGTLLGAPVGGFLLSWAGPEGQPPRWAFDTIYLICGITGTLALLLALRWLLQHEEVAHASPGERFRRFISGIREVGGDRRVVLTSGMEGLQNLAMGALEAFLPLFAVGVAGLSAFQAGLLWGAQVAAVLLAKPIMGRISDQRGRKPLILGGMVACAAAIAVIPALQGFWMLLGPALLFGLGEALVTSSTAALVADICKEKHYGTAMGVFGTLFDVGHASGPILGGVLVGAFGYQTAFLVIAALMLASLPLFHFGMSSAQTETP
ncbi:MAG: MFS transporter [Magnetococcales bacterium]|nr:MFS transporter [Magnetococcales bacterium]